MYIDGFKGVCRRGGGGGGIGANEGKIEPLFLGGFHSFLFLRLIIMVRVGGWGK